MLEKLLPVIIAVVGVVAGLLCLIVGKNRYNRVLELIGIVLVMLTAVVAFIFLF